MNDFGKYLRKTRIAHNKTQEEIANAMGKSKMLISGMELGKNNPPVGKDLEKMMQALELNRQEKNEFMTIVSVKRKEFPTDIEKYVIANTEVIDFIRLLKENNISGEKIENNIKNIMKLLKK